MYSVLMKMEEGMPVPWNWSRDAFVWKLPIPTRLKKSSGSEIHGERWISPILRIQFPASTEPLLTRGLSRNVDAVAAGRKLFVDFVLVFSRVPRHPAKVPALVRRLLSLEQMAVGVS